MRKSLVAHIIFLGCSCLTSSYAISATAYGHVTANIVAMSSVRMSGNIVLSEDTSRSGSVELNTFNDRNTAIIKIESSYNTTYSISVSHAAIQQGNAQNKVLINHLKIINTSESANADGEHKFHLAGMVNESAHLDSGMYTGETAITVNYN